MSNETAETSTAVPKKAGFPYRLLGFALILIAVVLYIRSFRAKAKSAEAAMALYEAVQEDGAIGVMVMHTLEGMDLPPILYRCDVDTATNLLTKMSQPEPTPYPKGSIEGDLFIIHVVGTNRVVREFRAIRPASDPENALVGRITREKGEDGKPHEVAAPPALVRGAGEILGDILKDLVERGEKLSADPKFKEDFDAMVKKAAEEMAAKAEAQKAAAEAPEAPEAPENP